jgi:negative regulator of flagellin synthesis FlgM
VPNKINDLTTSVAAGRSSATVTPTRESGNGVATAPAAATSGEVHITDTATQLAALEQTLRDSPAVDPARVEALRSAIEQGSYTVDPVDVATKFMQMDRALSVLDSKSSTAATAE